MNFELAVIGRCVSLNECSCCSLSAGYVKFVIRFNGSTCLVNPLRRHLFFCFFLDCLFEALSLALCPLWFFSEPELTVLQQKGGAWEDILIGSD